MRYAAFFRNLNLGRRHCPDRAQFEAAFLDAGAHAAKSFLTNGTIAFEARSLRAAENILADASHTLAAGCGLAEPGFLRETAYLADLLDTAPFKSVDTAAVYGCYVTFLHHGAGIGRLPPATSRGDVEVIAVTGTEALCVAHRFGKNPGSPNAFVEKALAAPATTRAWNTVVRLVQKHA
ncbi:MAG: DUF1697 domain-containing protein [Rhodanobacter sp.]